MGSLGVDGGGFPSGGLRGIEAGLRCIKVRQSGSDDFDSDILTFIQEVWYYDTNPSNIDTDGDGLNDYDELFVHYTNPRMSDTDGDGVTDYDEIFVYQTDPNNPVESPDSPLFSPLSLGIMIGLTAAVSIVTVLFLRKRKQLQKWSKAPKKLK